MEDGYVTTDISLYWNFSDIRDWCQLKAMIAVGRGGLSFGERKIKCIQALDWWIIYLTLQGKPIERNNFKSDILSDAIEESQLDYGYTR